MNKKPSYCLRIIKLCLLVLAVYIYIYVCVCVCICSGGFFFFLLLMSSLTVLCSVVCFLLCSLCLLCLAIYLALSACFFVDVSRVPSFISLFPPSFPSKKFNAVPSLRSAFLIASILSSILRRLSLFLSDHICLSKYFCHFYDALSVMFCPFFFLPPLVWCIYSSLAYVALCC